MVSSRRRRDGWDWLVAFYYNDTARPPKIPGGLAIETVHKGEASRDIEIAAGRSRTDIGRIVVSPISDRARAISDAPMMIPLRPCRVCRQPAPAGRCPHHPATANTYRPHRPSVLSGAYNGPWPTLRLACLDRDNWTCRYCGAPATTADHIVPRTRGGPTTLANLAAACQPCNRSKKDKTLAEWIATGNAPAGAIAVLERMSA